MCFAPSCSGRTRLANVPIGAVVRTKKIMMVPCSVRIERYSSGVMTPLGAPTGHKLSNQPTLA